MPEEKKPEPTKDDVNARIKALEEALAASRIAAPLNPIPEHGAGPGQEVEETWSLGQQERARHGGSAVP